MPAELSESFINPFQQNAFFNAKKELEVPVPEPTPEPSPSPPPEPIPEPSPPPEPSPVDCPGGICKIPKEPFFNKLKSKFGSSSNNKKYLSIVIVIILLILFGYFAFKKINLKDIKGIPNEL